MNESIPENRGAKRMYTRSAPLFSDLHHPFRDLLNHSYASVSRTVNREALPAGRELDTRLSSRVKINQRSEEHTSELQSR